MIIEKHVYVFDICSSTIMMEDVQMNSSLDSYYDMIDSILEFLKSFKPNQFIIYKFLGDGFILLFDESVSPEIIYKFSEELVDISNKIIRAFINEKMQNINVPRIGITIGVDSGILLEKKGEYVGRSINIACRLQGKLDLTESVNRIIISKKVYSNIKDQLIKKQFEYKPKTLKNVNDGKEFSCYESSPLVKSTIVDNDSNMKKETAGYIASSPSIIEKFQRDDGKFQFRIKRSNGNIVYTSGVYENEKDMFRKNDQDNDILPI